MAYLIRKFHRPWWEPSRRLPESISGLTADAITRCLSTRQNRLSVWKTESAEWGEFDDVLAAMFATFDGPRTADIVVIDERSIDEIEGVEIDSNAGETPAVAEINGKHRDVACLSHYSITRLAEIIVDQIRQGDNVFIKRYKEKEMERILKKHVADKKIDPNLLKQRWRVRLGLQSEIEMDGA